MRLIILLLLVLVIGCSDKPDYDDLVKQMVVQTHPDENTAFSFYNSFTMSPDTLGLLSNYRRDSIIRNDYSIQVTASIKESMTLAGYAFLAKNQNPDLGIAATVVENYNVFQQINYPSYYSGYYGYGYGGYYGVPYVSTYVSSSNTLVINLIDLKNRDQKNRLKVIWTAHIGDIVQSNDQTGNAIKAIEQAFAQSPYLKKP